MELKRKRNTSSNKVDQSLDQIKDKKNQSEQHEPNDNSQTKKKRKKNKTMNSKQKKKQTKQETTSMKDKKRKDRNNNNNHDEDDVDDEFVKMKEPKHYGDDQSIDEEESDVDLSENDNDDSTFFSSNTIITKKKDITPITKKEEKKSSKKKEKTLQSTPNTKKEEKKKSHSETITKSSKTLSTSKTPPTNISNRHLLSFEKFSNPYKLSNGILNYVKEQNFTYMTPVQIVTIKEFLNYKDVAVQAVTGSGKTLAFLIPSIEMILRRQTKLKKKQIGILILSPTRELAIQTHNVATELCKYCNQPLPLLLVGGSSSGSGGGSGSSGANTRPVTADIQTFNEYGSNIVIGTPGRVNDILNRYDVIDTSELECFILDEADVLLNMGFTVTITSILSRLPKMRRTGLFSATTTSNTSHSIKELIHKMGMRNPIWIDVTVSALMIDQQQQNQQQQQQQQLENKDHNDGVTSSNDIGKHDDNINLSTQDQKSNSSSIITTSKSRKQATPTSLMNYYHVVSKHEDKLNHLLQFMKQHSNEKIIVFFLTCSCVDFYGTVFQELLYPTTNKNKKNHQQQQQNNIDNNNITIELLHGKMVQKRREKSMERYRNHNSSMNNSAVDVDGGSNGNGGGIVLFCTDVAARGLDVNDIQWVIQYDAPQDPSFFIHRVGRTARAGKTGSSLIYLTKKEEAYIDFLQMKQIPMIQYDISNDDDNMEVTNNIIDDASNDHKMDNNSDTAIDTTISSEQHDDENTVMTEANSDDAAIVADATNATDTQNNILSKIRELVLHDRDLLEKGTKAFTSFIRAYKEHHCGFIFRFASLDLGLVANSFCLLRLPKMPELRDILLKHNNKLPNFHGAAYDINIFSIPYKDSQREVARQKRLEEVIKAGGKNAKEIKAERRKAEKEQKVMDRREHAIDKGRNPDKKRGRNAQIMDEWDDLAKEERLYKKLRNKKITEEEYNTQLNQL